MATAKEIADFLDGVLEHSSSADYPGAVNGLQMDGTGDVSTVACAVDFSLRTIQGALDVGATLLIVHHGMFWSGVRPFHGTVLRRIRTLVENGVAVYASHLPLDRHPELGNNVLLARELGLSVDATFASYGDMSIGVQGSADISTAELIARTKIFVARHHGHVTTAGPVGGRTTTRWAICTGAGASSETISEALAGGIDTLIVGEGPHWTAVAAEDEGITIIYAGHYATETLGVQAVGKLLEREFAISSRFIEAPTGL